MTPYEMVVTALLAGAVSGIGYLYKEHKSKRTTEVDLQSKEVDLHTKEINLREKEDDFNQKTIRRLEDENARLAKHYEDFKIMNEHQAIQIEELKREVKLLRIEVARLTATRG